ncbi:MAG: serine/threonine protein kinase [Methylomonas sp.]|nr:serine/threonine protein kinase [Methylomonas sp.]PPD21228.1 MAG: serine/threonine protein kinase [Methylomonas sp.]PPD27664.1 MAG: serine/threonine protein kinase [Methylomonas sp.]PPD39650.1 MAG: serine/threonine protein kinase [Methylomonas sp.]PPD51682.1 MAG: serine/threonine protein kinase [Methylomonas sp.]
MAGYYDPETYPQQWNYLQSGTIIDQYMIERELAHGGFSSVYLARQLADQVQVAIKEYLPRKLAHRTWNNIVVPNSEDTRPLFMRGRALFFEEAKVLATLKHHNIVEVINFFQANETVYMVMTYDYGITLDKILHKKRLPITEAFLLNVFKLLLNGLAVVHEQGLVHLDIKPANILIRTQFDPLLLDFGAIRRFPTGKSVRAKVLTNGFSPIEQYHNSHGEIGPWSDIYAVGASMRACLDMKIPPNSNDRHPNDELVSVARLYKRRFPHDLLQAIDWAMAVQPQDRPQSVGALQNALVITN